MDELRGPAAKTVTAQQTAILAVKEHFEQAGIIAKNHAARDLLVACQTRFIRDLLPREFFLRRPDHGDFGDGIDAHREMTRHRVGVHAEHGTGGETPLFARGGCQRREANDIPHRPDMLDSRAVAAIDLEPPTRVRGEADRLEV